jgi:cytochrome P450
MLRLTLAQGFVSALLSVCLVHSLLSFLRTRSRRQALASSQGCKDAPVNPHAGPFGIYELQEMKKAFHARVFLERSCKQYERYGFTFTSGFMAQKIVHTIEPENIKAVLSTNFAHYGIGSRRQNAFRPLLGESIFQLDGHAWAHSRSVLQSGFGRVQIENLDACEMYIEGVLKEIEEKTASEGHVDLAPIFHRLAAKLAVSFTCGFSPDSPAQEGGVTADEFVQAMHDASRVCEERWQMGPLSFLLPQKQFKRDIAKLHSYMESHVDQVLSSLDVKHEKKRDDFLAALAEKTKDRTALRDEACMLILAGTDTTACLLTNMFFIIGRSPAVWQKLREEVLVLNGRSPTSNDLKQLKYHQACVKESQYQCPILICIYTHSIY